MPRGLSAQSCWVLTLNGQCFVGKSAQMHLPEDERNDCDN
jgi:hypothetical protein